jgi:cobalamin biosynthesis Mg chelatase CobN
VTINNPTSTPASVPDTYVTVPGSTSSSTDITQEPATESSTASSTASTGTGNTGSQVQTAIPDEQTPLAGSNTDVADEPAAPNLLIILLALLFLALMIVLGWLLLRHTRY